MSLSTAPYSGIMIPVAHKVGENMDRTAFENFRREFLTDKKKVKIAHNLSFESMFSYKDGIVIQGPVYDTIAASQMTLKTATEFRNCRTPALRRSRQRCCTTPCRRLRL
jgi:DNA polymerase-1